MFGLHIVIWVELVLYFSMILGIGWWARKSASSQEGFLIGGRRFGVFGMIMHSFGAGTNPGDAAGVVTGTVNGGASGIWVSWMWLFGTPFYWLIAPVIRRMRCLTMAEFFRERFNKKASVLYVIVASIGMIICLASVLLATARIVQGMMGKSFVPNADLWFFGILAVITLTFTLYGYWGGIVAAVRNDMIQGLMIIVLSFLAIPAAFKLQNVGGFSGMISTLTSASSEGNQYLQLFNPAYFKLTTIILLSINAPLTALSFPHLISVCGAGKTEWEGRMGFVGGNMLKRFCTIGWSIIGLAWLAYLLNTGSPIHAETAFGDAIRHLLPPVLQGLMLASVMAAAMSSCDAFTITVAGLFSQSIYKVFVNPQANDKQLLTASKIASLLVAASALGTAILMRQSMIKAILDYFNIMSLVGISVAMGILWRRMNSAGMISSTLVASAVFIVSRYSLNLSRDLTIGLPIIAGIVAGVAGSLLTAPPDRERTDKFYAKIYTPIGQEEKLSLPLSEAVPESKRLTTAGGLFLVKPTRQTWVGFAVTVAACIAFVGLMQLLLKGSL